MATVVIMPKVGISVETCTIFEWKKDVGDVVRKGEILFSYETDKITLEEEAKIDGVLLARFVEAGEEVECLKPVCVIGERGESINDLVPVGEVVSSEKASDQRNNSGAEAEMCHKEMIAASPRAKRFAKENDIELKEVSASGANDRIIERDVRQFRDSKEISVADENKENEQIPEICAGTYTDNKMSSIRKAIAKSMLLSVTTIPQVTHTVYFDATNILRYRNLLKTNSERLELENITLNDMIIYAVSRVLSQPKYKGLNSHVLENDIIRTFDCVNIGIAVDTARGLMVPTVFEANKKTLGEISSESKIIARLCKEGNINPDMLQGATFTVSNLGAYGIESFTPIVNPPQVGILGINSIMTRVRENNDLLEAYKAIGLSLSYDHRAIDGAPASAFLKKLTEVLETFPAILSI